MLDNIDGNLEALNAHMREMQSGEDQLEEAQELIDIRLCDIIEDDLLPLVQEIKDTNYCNGDRAEAKRLIIEHLDNLI